MVIKKLECVTFIDIGNDLNNKTAKYRSTCGTIKRTLNKNARQETEVKFYKVRVVSVSLYVSK
jgi:hypothetical protein